MIIFKKTKDASNDNDQTELIMKSDNVSYVKLMEDFKDFLRGCGYFIPDEDT